MRPAAGGADHPGRGGLHRNILTILLYAALTVSAAAMLFPFFWMVTTGLKSAGQVLIFPPRWIPVPPDLENFATVWTVRPFGRWLVNSTAVAGSVTILQLISSSLAAYAFARLRFAGRDRLFLLYLGTLMVPPQVTLIPNYVLMRYLGWIDSYQALILPAAFGAFGTFLLRQFFLTIPMDLQDAARIDGANHFRIYWRIVLPLAKPALAALAIFTFVNQWNSFLWPLVITHSPGMQTVTVGLQAFQGQYGSEYQLLMAAVTLSIIPMLIVFLSLQRYFVEGIAFSGLAGR